MNNHFLENIDWNKPIDLSWPLIPNRDLVRCYWADTPINETIRSGSFVGSIKAGGAVNYTKITLTPHGNGTHTECFGHVASGDNDTIGQSLQKFIFKAKLITVSPLLLPNGDSFVSFDSFIKATQSLDREEAVIIRTLSSPNSQSIEKDYSGTNPPYFDAAIAEWLVSRKVLHFLTDLPSVDRESDGGRLKFHKTFFGLEYGKPREGATISELLFFPKGVEDGTYLLNLMVPQWHTDAAPSRPIIYRI